MKGNDINRTEQHLRPTEETGCRSTSPDAGQDCEKEIRWGLSHLNWQHAWNVLDIGCGDGTNISRMLDLCPQGLIYGIDAGAGNVALARRHNQDAVDRRCFISQGTALRLPFDVDTFDVVTLFGHSCRELEEEEVVAEVYRVLKPDGRLLVCAADGIPSAPTGPASTERKETLTSGALRDRLLSAGFTDIGLHTSDTGSVCITAREGSRTEF